MIKRAVAVLGILALLALPGCSSSGGGSSQQSQIEQDVEALLGFLAVALADLDPFAGAPAPGDSPQGGVCSNVSLPDPLVCATGGPIQECPVLVDLVEVHFNACTIVNPLDPSMSIRVTGIVAYTDTTNDPNWPDGSRQIEVATPDEHWQYDVTLNGTASVMVDVTDLDSGTLAECTGNLETEQADCEIVEIPVN